MIIGHNWNNIFLKSKNSFVSLIFVHGRGAKFHMSLSGNFIRRKFAMSDLFSLIRSGTELENELLTFSGEVSAVRAYIKSEGPHVVNRPNKENLFALHVAAKLGKCDVKRSTDLTIHIYQIVATLLKSGAKLLCLDREGLTPLHYAAKGNHKEVLLELVNHNPQVCCPRFFQKGHPRQHINCQDQNFMTPLHYASLLGHEELVLLLCDNKARFVLLTSPG